jgi:hypothetical protein
VGPSVATVQTPRMLFPYDGMGRVLDIAIDEVLGELSMHATPLTIWIVVVPSGVTILLGLHNPPRSWTGTVGPSLLGFTIAPCVD